MKNMNLYLISFFNWDDSENILLSHEKEYTDNEFKQLCKIASQAIDCDDCVRKLPEYLITNFGFRYPPIKKFLTNDSDVKIIQDGFI